MNEPALAETPEDIAYVTADYVRLEAIARPGHEAAIGRQVPGPTYRLPDGTSWFARDLWRIADDAGGPQGARALFARRYHAACDSLGLVPELPAAWAAYLAGEYGACLRDVTPEAIAAKTRLVARLDLALTNPRPDDPTWRAGLRADVDALHGLERPFASCDRLRFGRPTSRDRLITGARQRYPAAFADEGAPAEVSPVAPVAPPVDTRRDVAIRLPHRPGALAELGEVLGRAGCSIEGGGGFQVGDVCVVHFLLDDAARAAEVLRAAGFDVMAVRDVVVQRLNQGRPGQLGSIARAMATAGVNIEAVYSDHDHRLILGVDDLAAATRAAASWSS